VVGEVLVEVDTCIVIMAIPLCREHVGGLLTSQELYGTFREETPVKDKDLPSNIEFIDRVFPMHLLPFLMGHCQKHQP